jgi:hypothetical protein
LLAGLNESIKKRTKRQRARIALHVVTTAERAAALWAPRTSASRGLGLKGPRSRQRQSSWCRPRRWRSRLR